MLGMNNEFSPRFLRRYMNLYEGMTTAIQYVADVKSSDFPNEKSINHLLKPPLFIKLVVSMNLVRDYLL
jgi:ketopantoate hydroxymethyltransferase